jgi:type VI secretion system secreted protein VgrG
MKMYTQDDQPIQILTPLGKDELLLRSFSGTEAISRLFHFELEMYSENHAIAFDSLVGKQATIKIVLSDGSERYINGLINTFSQGGTSAQSEATASFATYRVTLVPWFWMLTRTSDCRIFQDKNVPDIIRKIFQEYKFQDFQMRLHGSFEKRDYCVQYRESDFNFISRLMEEEGICYFFEHTEDKHVMVLANHSSEFKACPDQPRARYNLDEGSLLDEDVITDWTIGQEVRPGKYEMTDYNFEQPALTLTASVTGRDARRFEIYEYPGEYLNRRRGEQLVSIRMQEQETSLIKVVGSSTCRGFCAGTKFELSEHYRPDLNKSYVLTSVSHAADVGTSYRSARGASRGASYSNQVECIPSTTPFRPPRITPTPLIHGSQTAIVVGRPGDEIYTDQHGRVKVQFHWDREGKRNEESSCWIRVSQPWAGKNWGTVAIPRIGQEVIVDFLEGDPDRPIITGRVYNGQQIPPYGLPAGAHVMGFRSNSTKGGGGYNEISIHDGKSDEKVVIHAQKNMYTTVENDDEQTVMNDRTIKVNGKQSETIKGNMTTAVTEGDQSNEVVTGQQSNTVKGNMLTIVKSGDQSNEVQSGTQNNEVKGMIRISSTSDQIYVEASTAITLRVGSSELQMDKSGNITLTGVQVTIVGSSRIDLNP